MTIHPTQLTPSSCRWPIGEPRSRDFRHCGQECAAGYPYCQNHVAIAFQPVRKRQVVDRVIPSIYEVHKGNVIEVRT